MAESPETQALQTTMGVVVTPMAFAIIAAASEG